jgi:arylsulfatase A-like enzyme
MNRRNFLSLAGLGAAASQSVAQEIAQRTEDSTFQFINQKQGLHPYRRTGTGKRPNIFVVTLDMVTPDHWHPSRSMREHLNLPAIRSIGEDGVNFTNCFTTSPLCGPARAALATGRYTYITANGERAHDGHETHLRPDDVLFQEYLKATGYTTKHSGKGHLGVKKFVDAFDENVKAWDRWAPPVQDDEDYHTYLRRLGVKPQRYKKELTGLQQDRKSPWASWGGWIEQEDGQPFPLEAQYSFYLAGRALEKLDAATNDNSIDSPLYLQLDIFDPHQPFSIPAGFEKREQELRQAFRLQDSYKRVQANDWKRFPNEPKIYDLYRKNWGLYEEQTALDYMVGNALQMEVCDRAVNHLLRGIKQRGLYDESLILFTVDHGEMNSREALVDKGVYLHPDVVRVPMSVKMPKSAGVKHHTVDAPVSHLDVAPTLLEVAGVEPMARLDGESLLPHLESTAQPANRELLFECGWHVGVNFACAMQRWEPSGEQWMYTYNCSDEFDELYDMNSADPRNLARSPSHAKQYRDMVQYMGAFLERDPRWRGYWHTFRLDRYNELPKLDAGDVQMFKPI